MLTLPPCFRCSLNWLLASRLLLPRSGLERSDFVLWPEADRDELARKAADELARDFKCGQDTVKVIGTSGRAVGLALKR